MNLGKLDVDFSAYTSEDGMNTRFFDYKDWAANSKDLTTADERRSMDGMNRDLPIFPMVKDKFLMCFVSTEEDRASSLEKMSKIPHLDKMKKIAITK